MILLIFELHGSRWVNLGMSEWMISLPVTGYFLKNYPKILGSSKFLGPKPGLTGLMCKSVYGGSNISATLSVGLLV
jgi:hypothetical protein